MKRLLLGQVFKYRLYTEVKVVIISDGYELKVYNMS